MKALATALVKAQAAIEGAKKDSTNPHFKNKYADLGSVWDACREALHKNGFSVVQYGTVTEAGAALVTKLLHESGESIEGLTPLLNTKGDMQGLGSAWTYARRYGLAAIVGVCPEDDDANAASEKPAKAAALVAPVGFADWLADFEAAADNGLLALKEAWDKTTPENRAYLDATMPNMRQTLKARAQKVAA
jgi:hypothetical protein